MGKIKVVMSGCWEWQGEVNSKGYGVVKINGKRRPAHQAIWELKRGVIVYELHHRCRNRRCVNPGHMEEVTKAEHKARQGKYEEAVRLPRGEPGEIKELEQRLKEQRRKPGPRRKRGCRKGHIIAGSNVYRAPNGHEYCLECKKAKLKEWRMNNAEKSNEQRRRYRENRRAREEVKEEVTQKVVDTGEVIYGPIEGYDEPWADVKARMEAQRRRYGIHKGVGQAGERGVGATGSGGQTEEERKTYAKLEELKVRRAARDEGVEVDLVL